MSKARVSIKNAFTKSNRLIWVFFGFTGQLCRPFFHPLRLFRSVIIGDFHYHGGLPEKEVYILPLEEASARGASFDRFLIW